MTGSTRVIFDEGGLFPKYQQIMVHKHYFTAKNNNEHVILVPSVVVFRTIESFRVPGLFSWIVFSFWQAILRH
jgi:hypothetical protein